MHLEQAIAALIAAVNANTEALNRAHAASVAAVVAPQQAQQPVVHTAVATGMPAAPNFAAPQQPQFTASVQQAPVAPFNTAQDLMNYTMAAYQAMGQEKGSKIQGILQGLGIGNLNDLKPEQYGQFYQQVEALKAGA